MRYLIRLQKIRKHGQEVVDIQGRLSQVPSFSMNNNRWDSHLKVENTFILPPTSSTPAPLTLDTKENHVAVMRYPIDFLMKHNIAFSCPLFFFFFFCHHTRSHKRIHTDRGKKINIIQYALQSQTPSNLSALDFKVWVFAYFVLDCCHFVFWERGCM